MRLNTQTVLTVGVAAAIGYFLYQRWQEQKRAAAHPIDNPRLTLEPVTFDPALVGRTGTF